MLQSPENIVVSICREERTLLDHCVVDFAVAYIALTDATIETLILSS